MAQMIDWTPLSSRVIAVAKEGEAEDWACYIDAVPGYDHSQEWQFVLASGDKLPRSIAEVLFPHFKHLKYRGL